MKEDHLFALTSQCGIEQLARKQAAGIRHHDKSHTKFAALGFVDGQSISELQRCFAFIAEIGTSKAKLVPKLRRELDLNLPREALWLPAAPFELPDDNSDLSVREI